jgi:signal transduction histidine kinase
MRAPVFYKTIGFKIALWYTALLILFGILMVVSLNVATWQAKRNIPIRMMGGMHTPAEVAVIVADQYQDYVRLYSFMSFGSIVVLGGVGGYFLSKRTLKTVDNVTTLADRISTTNLRERIAYEGPDDEMKRLADTFDGMLSRLENAFESQNQFIQDASHELRTPIAIAQTNIDVLEMEKKPTINEYKHLVDVFKLSIDRLSKLSDKLLVLSKDKKEKTEWSIVNMSVLLGEVATEFKASAKNQDVNLQLLSIPEGLRVKGDVFTLKQAVSNIIDNAVRYNKPGGTVSISITVTDQWLIIQIKDSGIGISEEDQDHIFDRFYRVDKSRSRAQGGSGLGLAMVKKIIESHHGKIQVDSTLGKGSVFSIYLPTI